MKPHDFIERDGDDLYCKVTVSFVQAILGDRIEVPTLEAVKVVEIGAGTQPGAVLRYPGEGVRTCAELGRGDLLVEIGVNIPTRIDRRQEELLREFIHIEREHGDHKVRKWPWRKRGEKSAEHLPGAAGERGS